MKSILKLPKTLLRVISTSSPVEFFVANAYVPSEILHIGAHLAEEKVKYVELGINSALWVEAQPDIYEILSGIVGREHSLNAAVWSSNSNQNLKISRNSVSSSLLDLDSRNPWKALGNELQVVKEMQVKTMTLDEVIQEFKTRGALQSDFFIVLDIQGAEFKALSGWRADRSQVVGFSCEVSKRDGYSGAARRWKINFKMLSLGYMPAAAFLDNQKGHGDQLFIRLIYSIRYPKLLVLSLIRTFILFLIRIQKSSFRIKEKFQFEK